MKRNIFTILFCALAAVSVSAQSTISLERKDGNKIHTSLENFLRVTFTDEDETLLTDTFPVYKDLQLEAVDQTQSRPRYLSFDSVGCHLWAVTCRLEGKEWYDCYVKVVQAYNDEDGTVEAIFGLPEFSMETSESGEITLVEDTYNSRYFMQGTYAFIFNDINKTLRFFRLFDEADATEKIIEVEVEARPQSDFTVDYNIGSETYSAAYLGDGLWKCNVNVVKDCTFSITRTGKDNVAISWGAAQPQAAAAMSDTIVEGSAELFTLGFETGRYALLFDDENGSFAFMKLPKTIVRTLTFDGDEWDDLIDNSQYGGRLLYGADAADYKWSDEESTGLKWDGFDGGGLGAATYASGGYAISNYVADPKSDPTIQLSIPFGDGSNNFCMTFNRADEYMGKTVSPIYFADGKARAITSIDVTNSSYAAGSLLYGDWAASPAKEGTEFIVNILGHKADGSTKVVQYHLCKDTDILLDKWVTVDCTPLGKVTSIEIYVSGSADISGDYGLNTPGYVAIDNIVVEY